MDETKGVAVGESCLPAFHPIRMKSYHPAYPECLPFSKLVVCALGWHLRCGVWMGRLICNCSSSGNSGLGWGPGGDYSGAGGSNNSASCGTYHCSPLLWAPEGAVVTLQESVGLCHWTPCLLPLIAPLCSFATPSS